MFTDKNTRKKDIGSSKYKAWGNPITVKELIVKLENIL